VLAKQALYHFCHAPSPLCFSLFFIRVSLCSGDSLRLQSSHLYLSYSRNYRMCATRHGLFAEMGYCLHWPLIAILLISASWVAGVKTLVTTPRYFLFLNGMHLKCKIYEMLCRVN
jgi:hypothetical protein